MQRSIIGTLPAKALANTRTKTPIFSKFRLRISNQHHGASSSCVYILFLALPFFSFPPFLNTLPSDGRGMNYSSVICPQAGHITQPQSCAFFHGVDCMRSTLDRRSLSATLG
ncbi:hypothetical protein AVEN_78340-1 [Araneus ventricosus]|uniref:Uncharacterized protein n=1 Tax=Araneus ventricosus TaxID=182803 RepID=A0A4Y2J2E1_ARAVE|nr:hypothetical protein AVEN_78340-1 [Araneus ventricosus]